MRMATSNVLEMVGIDMFEGSFSIGRGPCRLPALPIIDPFPQVVSEVTCTKAQTGVLGSIGVTSVS